MRQNMYRNTDDQRAFEKMERPPAEYASLNRPQRGHPAAVKPRPRDDYSLENERLGSSTGSGGRKTRAYRRNNDNNYSEEDFSSLGRAGGGRGQYRTNFRGYGNQGERGSERGQRDDDCGRGQLRDNRRRDRQRENENWRYERRNPQEYDIEEDSDHDGRWRSPSSSRPQTRKESGKQRRRSREPEPRGNKGGDRRPGRRGVTKSGGSAYDSDKYGGDHLEGGDFQENAEEDEDRSLRRKGSGRNRR